MNPAIHARVVLAEYRDLGVGFDVAWATVMRTLPRKSDESVEWKRALRWARPAYQAAYEKGAFSCNQDGSERSVLVRAQPKAAALLVGRHDVADLAEHAQMGV